MPKKRPNLTIETGSTSGSTTSDVNKTLTSMNNMKLEDTVIAAGGENTLSARVSETNTGGRGSAASSVSNLEIKRSPSSMFGFDLTSKKNMTMDEFEKLEELGVGNGGVVTKVKVKKTGKVMAQKLVRLEVKKEIHKRIVNELKGTSA